MVCLIIIGIVKQGDHINALLNGHHDLQSGQFKSLSYDSLLAAHNGQVSLWLYAKDYLYWGKSITHTLFASILRQAGVRDVS